MLSIVTKRLFALLLSLVLLASACVNNDQAGTTEGAFHPEGFASGPPSGDVYDPVRAGEELPGGFRQLLARDAIKPVYDPLFVPGSEADWPDDELVIGVDLDGEARAYPVGFLNRREIVVDMHRGIPTFVTW